MKSVIVISVFIFLLMISVVLAFDTDITIKGDSGDSVDIRVYSTQNEKLEEFLGIEFDSDGEIEFTHSSSRTKIQVHTFIRENAEGIKKFKDIDVGGSILIDLTSLTPTVEYLDVENGTGDIDVSVGVESNGSGDEVVEEKIDEESVDSGITGSVVGKGVSIKAILYTIVIIIVVAVLVVGGVILMKRRHKGDKFVMGNVPKPSNDSKSSGDSPVSIEDAERKLKEAQEEIEKLKDKDGKIREAERKFEEDRLRLERLKRGEDI